MRCFSPRLRPPSSVPHPVSPHPLCMAVGTYRFARRRSPAVEAMHDFLPDRKVCLLSHRTVPNGAGDHRAARTPPWRGAEGGYSFAWRRCVRGRPYTEYSNASAVRRYTNPLDSGYPPRHVCAADRRFLLTYFTYLLTYPLPQRTHRAHSGLFIIRLDSLDTLRFRSTGVFIIPTFRSGLFIIPTLPQWTLRDARARGGKGPQRRVETEYERRRRVRNVDQRRLVVVAQPLQLMSI